MSWTFLHICTSLQQLTWCKFTEKASSRGMAWLFLHIHTSLTHPPKVLPDDGVNMHKYPDHHQ